MVKGLIVLLKHIWVWFILQKYESLTIMIC